MTINRKRQLIDISRLSKAVSRAGIDPRVWVAQARVDDDSNGFNWDAKIGWLVDVEPFTSGYYGDNETPTKQACINGEHIPPKPKQEITLLLPEGDINSYPLSFGQFCNATDGTAPIVVNNLPINGFVNVSTSITVSPYDTEIKVSEHSRREQYAGDFTIQSQNHVVMSNKTNLSASFLGLQTNFAEPVPLGNSLISELISIIDSLNQVLLTVSAATVPPTAAGVTSWVTEWQVKKALLSTTVLSKKTFTE